MGSSWTKEAALAELHALANQTRQLEHEYRLSENHTRWLVRCQNALEEVFGRGSRYYKGLTVLRWQQTGSLVVGGPADPMGSLDPQSALEEWHQQGYVRDLGTARGVLLGAVDQLERTDLESVYEGKDTGPESSAIVKVINLAERKLRKVIRDEPEQERQIQNAFEDLLVGADIPYARERESIEYSSKTYIPDFTIPRIDLAIEVKLCSRERREKEIIAEINDDILAYQTKYGNLLFIVYDIGHIRDTDLFSGAFEEHENVVVRVVKH